jgi:hypothetical protein
VVAKLNAVSLEAFAVFRNFLNDSTYVFKLAEVTMNRNKTTFYFLVFYIPFFVPALELYCETLYVRGV